MGFSDLTSHVQGICSEIFGEPVTYEPVSGSPYQVLGIFNERATLVDTASGAIRSEAPTLGIRLSDLSSAPAAGPNGDKITIRSKSYIVVDRINDGEGGSILVLHEAP